MALTILQEMDLGSSEDGQGNVQSVERVLGQDGDVRTDRSSDSQKPTAVARSIGACQRCRHLKKRVCQVPHHRFVQYLF